MSPARSDEGDRPPLVMPEIRLRADTWDPTNAGLIRVAGDSGALGEYYERWSEACATFRKHVLDYQETGEPIAELTTLASWRCAMKALCLDEGFSGPDDWRAFLTGQCLTLRLADGPVHGGEFASANVMLIPPHPERLGWRKGILAFPAELASAFGVQTYAWLKMRAWIAFGGNS